MIVFLKRHWAELVVFGAVLLAIWGIYSYGHQIGHTSADSEWQKKWDDYQLEVADANLEHEKKLRDQEREWRTKYEELEGNAEYQLDQIEGDLSAASAEHNSLYEQYKKATRELKSCRSPATTQSSGAAQETDDMPAIVFEGVDSAAGEMAHYADQLEVALLTCRAAHNEIRGPSLGPIVTD